MSSKPMIPWTMPAFATYLRHGAPVPEYTLEAARQHTPVPPDATFWNVTEQRWSTLRDITNPSCANHMKTYAKEHNRTIPRDVLLTWEREWGRQRLAQELHGMVEQVIEQQRAKDTRDRQGAINALITALQEA